MNAKRNIVWWCCARRSSPILARPWCRGVVACSLALTLMLFGADARADIAYAWGYNGNGQLGDGTTTQRDGPSAVPGLGTGVTSIGGGQYFSLAVRNGGVYAWGSDDSGQLGDGQAEAQRASPAPVFGLSSGVTAVACGWRNGLAIQNGGVYAWGYSSLGNGPTPAAVPRLASGVTAIAGGRGHNLALQNGGIFAWGSNSSGELGINSPTIGNPTPPLPVTGMSSGVTSIACGYSHSLAVKDGAAYAWGSNNFGQVGDGTTINGLAPVALTGLTSGVTSIAGGFNHSLAVRNGDVFAWGGNGSGQLGDGATTARSTPEQIDPTDLHNIIQVAAGDSSSYALSSDGSLWVWGFNLYGELGLGNENFDDLTPQHLLPPSGYRFTSIDADGAGFHAVATLAAVPEPGSLSLISIAAALLSRRRCERRKSNQIAARLAPLSRESAALHFSPAAIEILEERWLFSTLTVINSLDSGVGSLRAQVAAARSGDTVLFAPALVGNTITLTSGELLINRNLVIAGPADGNLTVSGGYKSRVFEVAKGKFFTLSGMAIIDGGASQGGAIFNRGTLTVSDCTFSSNSAVGIYNATGTARVSGCTFSDNTATVGGAAIVNDGTATLTLSNSALSRNTVGNSGGAVNNSGTMNIINSTLAGNFAQYGGAIYTVGSMAISGSSFSNNTGNLNGGAIYSANSYFNSGTLNLSDSTLSRNSAGNYGGGICVVAGTFAIANSSVNDNSAKYGGGVSYLGGVLTLSASTLTGNTASFKAGGIFVTNRLAYGGSVTVENSSIIFENTAPSGTGPDVFNNGGLYLDGSSTIGVLDGAPAILL